MTRHFIAGAVVYRDTDECAKGVSTTLTADGKWVKIATNSYGNFEFDGLEMGRYTVTLECAGYTSKTIDIDLQTDCYLGEIILTKA